MPLITFHQFWRNVSELSSPNHLHTQPTHFCQQNILCAKGILISFPFSYFPTLVWANQKRNLLVWQARLDSFLLKTTTVPSGTTWNDGVSWETASVDLLVLSLYMWPFCTRCLLLALMKMNKLSTNTYTNTQTDLRHTWTIHCNWWW